MALREDRQTMRQMLDGLNFDEPVGMLNLIKFRTEAKYPSSRPEPPCSGAEAYKRYRMAVSPLIDGLGATVVFIGQRELIGPEDEWDTAFVVHYPSVHAFLSLIENPDYAAISHHRYAAVADSRLLAMKHIGASLAALPASEVPED